MRRVLLWMVFPLMVSGFHGVYHILYPIRKMVRFDEKNHYISHEGDIVFTRHPRTRDRFRVHNLTEKEILLVNVRNASDYILLSQKLP